MILAVATVLVIGYFILKPSKANAGNASGSLSITTMGDKDNASDKEAIDLINQITASYSDQQPPEWFQQSIDRLDEVSKSGLTPVNCFVAPCPEKQKLSADVDAAVKSLITRLVNDNNRLYSSLWGGEGGK